MFQDWENIQQLSPRDAAKIIFEQFEKCKASDEMDSMILYAEHMVEVGQYLRRKLIERKEKNGRQNGSVTVTNSKFWYEVRKKIQEVLDSEKRIDAKDEAENDEDSDDINNDSAVHTTSADSEVIKIQSFVLPLMINDESDNESLFVRRNIRQQMLLRRQEIFRYLKVGEDNRRYSAN